LCKVSEEVELDRHKIHPIVPYGSRETQTCYRYSSCAARVTKQS